MELHAANSKIAIDPPLLKCGVHGALTQVLYIGQTGQLGGESDRSRLYGYRYPSGKHGRLIRSKTDRLITLGHEITFRWSVAESEEESKRIEAELLQMHLAEHLEFPPFNGKS